MNIVFTFLSELFAKCSNRKLIILGTGHKAVAVCNYIKALQKQSEILFLAQYSEEMQQNDTCEYVIRSAYDILYFVNKAVVLIANDHIEESILFLKCLSKDVIYEIWQFDIVKPCNYFDPQLGYSRIDDIPGYSIYEGNVGSKKIMILGGSTSDHTFDSINSWPYLLYEKFDKGVTVYNGGIVGYNSSQELLKLCRDISIIHPDIVISYSGINDCYRGTMNFEHPYTSLYFNKTIEKLLNLASNSSHSSYSSPIAINYGLKNNNPPHIIWIDNEKKMKGICDSCGALFLGVLQVSLFSTGYIIHEEERTYLNYRHSQRAIDEYFYNIRKIEEYINECPENYLYSIHDRIRNMDSLFYDHCHGGEELNTLIANSIYSILIDL